MLVTPKVSHSGIVTATTTFLAPHFEERRVRMLGIPSAEDRLDIVVWEEHRNPFETLMKSYLFRHFDHPPKVMVDEELRDFISRGLASAGFRTVGLSTNVELVRQVKSPAEVDILRAVNTGTVAAVRAVRPCLRPGLTENQVREILDAALTSVGFGKFFNIVLFEQHAALPHGGFGTGEEKLTHETMVLVDVGAHYMGYSSDICRSFFIGRPGGNRAGLWDATANLLTSWPFRTSRRRHLQQAMGLHSGKLKIWDVVLEAQTAAARQLRPNNTAASVDIAARNVIADYGYGEAFTHRVGHGIGVKGTVPRSLWSIRFLS